MKRVLVAALLLFLAACGSTYRDRGVPISSMAVFQPERYAGTWYEVASFPTPFQKGCTRTRAEYGLLDDGRLSVRNTCVRGGALAVIEGSAQVTGPGRLSVRLNGVPFPADYWVLWVDEGYRTAVVGSPSGRAGWILNRDPQIPADRLEAARSVLAFNGYDVSRLVRTPQGTAP
ncbi:MAG: lipocalin family protein [Silicimonas sp.]|jgi:apolipoprotein D and lipocalin family protein|nr:lipocalin family protein [Silicimonas sp.]